MNCLGTYYSEGLIEYQYSVDKFNLILFFIYFFDFHRQYNSNIQINLNFKYILFTILN
jgi:hypothetical protein